MKSAVFGGLDPRAEMPLALEGAQYRAERPPWAGIDTSWVPERAAVIVDLPGAEAIHTGLALGERGLRPVLAISTSSSYREVIPMDEVLAALCEGARFASAFPVGPALLPAFILDARRDGEGAPRLPGLFDNRWAVFPDDLPSARVLRTAGATRVVVVQQGDRAPMDLVEVLRAYAHAGLEILAYDPHAPRLPGPMVLPSPRWWGDFVERTKRRWTFWPRPDDGFGRRIPIPNAPSHG
jgi:hypothetical protein